MADHRQYTALEWVLKEIKDTLGEAQDALSRYRADTRDITQLRFSQTLIHQVYGSLHMVGFHGASMVAEEMEILAQAILEGHVVAGAEPPKVLHQAIEELPDYLDRVQKTKRDYSGVVLVLLNEMRAARKASLVTEATLFAPNLKIAHREMGNVHPVVNDETQLIPMVKKLRQMYQYAISCLVNGIETEKNTAYLIKVSDRFEKLLRGTKRHSVWHIAHAFFVGLKRNDISSSLATKQIFYGLDNEIGMLERFGIQALHHTTDDSLLKNLLYYIGISDSSDVKILSVKKRYSLDRFMPKAFVDKDDESFVDLDTASIALIIQALEQEFSQINTKLDHCLQGEDVAIETNLILAALNRISDTLALLGVGNLREKISKIANEVYAIKLQEEPVPSERFLGVKQAVRNASGGLEQAFEQSHSDDSQTVSLTAEEDESLNESRNLLERSKDAIVDYLVSDWSIDRIDQVPENLEQVRDALNTLELHRAANIISGCIVYVRNKLIIGEQRPQWQQLDSLADVISSVDYYTEYLSVDGENDESILEKAETALSVLGVAPAKVSSFPSIDSTASQLSPFAEEVEIESEVEATENLTEIVEEDHSDTLIDDEVMEIFCEEAEEIQETLAEFCPQWAEQTDNEEPLGEIRRAFHTLKGSGRMVGAEDIGELAWSIENMLNRVLDKTIAPTQVQLQLIDKVRTILPDMVSAFRSAKTNPFQHLTQQCITLGHQLSRGEQADELIEELFPAAPNNEQYDRDSESDVSIEYDEDSEVDSQLWGIFVSEARTHLEVVAEFITQTEGIKPFFEPPTDALQRALHTIKGSAYMAEFTRLAEMVAPLEKFAKELRNYQVAVDEDIFQLIKDCRSYTEDALSDIEERRQPIIPKFDQFLARTHELRERTLGHMIRKQQEEAKKVDPAMLEMLMTKEMDLLLNADMMIDEWQQGEASASDWQPVLDELLVVQQGAEKANLASMAELCGALAGCYQHLIIGTLLPNADNYAVILDGHDGLMDFCDAMAAGQDLPVANQGLMNQLQDLITRAKETPPKASDRPEADSTDELPQLTQAEQPVSTAEIDEDDDIDEDAIEIFYEEAQELLEEIDSELHDWDADGDAQTHNIAIQRALHTFKGGARMARLMQLGDLAHDFESWLIQQSHNTDLTGLVTHAQQYQDKLIRQTEMVAAKFGLAGMPATDSAEDASAITPPSVAEIPDTSGLVSNDDDNDQQATPNVLNFPQRQSAQSLQAIEPNTNIPKTVQTDSPNSGTGGAVARKALPQETVKVSADLMESLVNLAGETSINRGRVEEQVSHLGYSLDEMTSTVQRLQEQLRRLDIETEAQVIFRQEQLSDIEDFDPLEMDRYSQIQQLSRSLIESASDLVDLRTTLADKTRDVESVLLEQSRINTELQEGLMRSRMVPFSRIVPRLRRIVRQIASELNKDVQLQLGNVEGDLDKNMMEKMVAPLEHMLRNAIDHGIESADLRREAGKPERGTITINLARDGADVLIQVEDDGAGIDISRVREKAIERELMTSDAELTDQEVLQFILYAGFSTAEQVTQISGRGVGMDVVHSEIKQMGGSIVINSHWGSGTSFTIRVPFTVSVNRALMVSMGEDLYAVPLNTIEGIVRISPFELEHYYANPDEPFEYAGQSYDLRYLGSLIDASESPRLEGHTVPLPVLLLRSTEHSVAVHVDSLQGSREIVVKSLGAQFKSVQGVSGAAILGDGNVVVILDPNAMVRRLYAQDTPRLPNTVLEPLAQLAKNPLIMVVDDSVTVRKVTSRLLEREGYEVVLAKDGFDAMTKLQDVSPDVMLLDIEMPRMDGFEVAKNVRSNVQHRDLPIIMITSRTSDKHRQRGLEAGANLYMGKPYQEAKLLQSIREFLEKPGDSNG